MSLPAASAEAVIVAGVSAVDVTAGGWMRFVSGLRRAAIAVLLRIRMKVLISMHRLRRLSPSFCRVSRWVSIVRVKRVARLLPRSR